MSMDEKYDEKNDVVLGSAADHLSRQSSRDVLPKGVLDPVYQAKAEVLNRAIQEIGYGHYQTWLFFVTGFGWLVDNLWPSVMSLILTPVVNEFHTKDDGAFFLLSESVGLFFGAIIFGLGCDIWGRRPSFNSTLLLVGIFSTASAGSPNYVALNIMTGIYNVGVGGNLPVDSAIFLEFLPGTHQYLLTVLSVWWAWGQLLAALVAWPLLPKFSCAQTDPDCVRSKNMGWRYYVIIMGVLMFILWIIRFFVFKLHESPKYLMGRGRDAEAVEVVHKVAAFNGKTSTLTLEDLQRCEVIGGVQTTAEAAVKRSLEKLSLEHVKALFKTKQMAWSTSLIIAIWALIGLAFPLYGAFIPYFFATRGASFGDGSTYITYRNQVILAVIGVPGAIAAGWLVDIKGVGRKGTLAASTLLTGVFLFCSTTARTSNALLGWTAGFTFASNVAWGVLYAMTPELFPTKDRGTGNALAATANRVFGIMSPIIALYANLTTSVPVWVAGTLCLMAGLMALLLPLDPRGKTSM